MKTKKALSRFCHITAGLTLLTAGPYPSQAASVNVGSLSASFEVKSVSTVSKSVFNSPVRTQINRLELAGVGKTGAWIKVTIQIPSVSWDISTTSYATSPEYAVLAQCHKQALLARSNPSKWKFRIHAFDMDSNNLAKNDLTQPPATTLSISLSTVQVTCSVADSDETLNTIKQINSEPAPEYSFE